jgi:carboxyl-terminal processing protease
MLRYTVQLFGVTLFALALIWIVGSGEAVQLSTESSNLWADTSHIYLEGNEEVTVDKDHPSSRDTFFKNIKILQKTAFNIRNQYMEEIDPNLIIKAGIKGMLTDLDRYSVLLERSHYEALMESTHGKYEGLGMQIDGRGNRITIITPIEGTPAYKRGLKAGDVIYEINGQTTEGMSASDASKIMRGKAGTSVSLSIKRTGIDNLLDFEIERAIIELKSVNYVGLVPGTDIGYIRLSRFSEETSQELRSAISELNEQNVSGLVFDLRSNGGGLLNQAIETSELFLPKGSEIVYTKGKLDSSERHYSSERAPLFPDKPLVILVDEGTASASEIVAGAIQDWDRGLIVGNNTYGKGLVQQIFDITNDGSMALKLTVAKYYVPSGRCIQKPETQSKYDSEDHAELMEQQAEESDEINTESKNIFHTNAGRIVYGGGGIIPDIDVDRETWKPIEINLERKSLFFDYAVKYVADNPDVTRKINITDAIVNDFKKFVAEKDFDYKTSLQTALEKLETEVNEEDNSAIFNESLNSIKALIEKEKEKDFDESLDYIKRTLKREIVASLNGERGVYEEIILKTDKSVLKAIDILSSKKYSEILLKGQTKAEL